MEFGILIGTLFECGFEPTRTIFTPCSLSVSPRKSLYASRHANALTQDMIGAMPLGAPELTKVLLETYGKDGVAMAIDEGGTSIEHHGAMFAMPGIAEEGCLMDHLARSAFQHTLEARDNQYFVFLDHT